MECSLTSILLLSQSATSLWLMQHLPAMVFVFLLGACVGSFVNVVNYRLPAGMSVIAPPSRCPTCGAQLRFFRENLPILGWFILRGKCRWCGARISSEYMLIELLMACLFIGLYIVLFTVPPDIAWWGEIGNNWWYRNGFFRTFPAFFALAFLIAGLVSMTIIDARTFTIPIQIPVFVTGCAVAFYALQPLLPLRWVIQPDWPIPGATWPMTLSSGLGLLGMAVALLLLKTGRIRYSFADYDQYLREDEVLADYPHARREMAVELLYLLPIIVGLVGGWFLGRSLAGNGPPVFLQAIGASVFGYFVGCGMIWGIRILGTLAFGREAMGLGDVHLLGAVGAVLGWFDPILIFFIAPFSGIAWVILSKGLGVVFRGLRRELPYGPHLAAATLIVILCRPGIEWLWATYLPTVPLPQPGLLP